MREDVRVVLDGHFLATLRHEPVLRGGSAEVKATKGPVVRPPAVALHPHCHVHRTTGPWR